MAKHTADEWQKIIRTHSFEIIALHESAGCYADAGFEREWMEDRLNELDTRGVEWFEQHYDDGDFLY